MIIILRFVPESPPRMSFTVQLALLVLMLQFGLKPTEQKELEKSLEKKSYKLWHKIFDPESSRYAIDSLKMMQELNSLGHGRYSRSVESIVRLCQNDTINEMVCSDMHPYKPTLVSKCMRPVASSVLKMCVVWKVENCRRFLLQDQLNTFEANFSHNDTKNMELFDKHVLGSYLISDGMRVQFTSHRNLRIGASRFYCVINNISGPADCADLDDREKQEYIFDSVLDVCKRISWSGYDPYRVLVEYWPEIVMFLDQKMSADILRRKVCKDIELVGILAKKLYQGSNALEV